MKLIITILQWLVAIILLIVAIHLKSPYLLKIRHIELASVLIIAIIFGILAFQQMYVARKKTIIRLERFFFLLLIVSIVILALGKERMIRYKRDFVLKTDTKQLQELGKHFIVGYLDLKEIIPLVSKGAIGGIFITHRNVKNKSVATVQQEIYLLQEIQKSLGLAPLLVATDQEGGIVSRLSPPLTTLPSLSSLVAQNRPFVEIKTEVKRYGEIHGKELANLGINVNFSPVVDLKMEQKQNLVDFHTLISDRAISTDKSIVAQVALNYSKSLEKYGVIPTVKHFPGIGRVRKDTHYFSTELNTATSTLANHDWVPFRYVIENSNAFMMLSHVKLVQVDSKHPVSYSYKVVQKMIREQWRYAGILITDDFNMTPIYYHLGVGQASIAALNAGVDLILLSYDGAQYYEAMYELLQADNLDFSQLQKSEERLDKIKLFLRNQTTH